jgi:hypothetical protein
VSSNAKHSWQQQPVSNAGSKHLAALCVCDIEEEVHILDRTCCFLLEITGSITIGDPRSETQDRDKDHTNWKTWTFPVRAWSSRHANPIQIDIKKHVERKACSTHHSNNIDTKLKMTWRVLSVENSHEIIFVILRKLFLDDSLQTRRCKSSLIMIVKKRKKKRKKKSQAYCFTLPFLYSEG